MKFAKFKLYVVKTMRLAFTVVAWLDFYCAITHTPIFGFTRTWGHLIADGVTAFLLFCWEDACYEEYAYSLAENTMESLKEKKPNLVSFKGKKDDDDE